MPLDGKLVARYDRGNYLLTRQAKIIAMTCTHAALKRHDFVRLGFQYDNLLMEESAQILEIETFIPMLLQVVTHDNEPHTQPVLKLLSVVLPGTEGYTAAKACDTDRRPQPAAACRQEHGVPEILPLRPEPLHSFCATAGPAASNLSRHERANTLSKQERERKRERARAARLAVCAAQRMCMRCVRACALAHLCACV